MKKKALMIAAPKSGSGKTLITCALISALKKRGIDVASIKCGPDYIDPMFHKAVLNIESNNLDAYFSDEKEVKGLFADFMRGKELCVAEGVMGLFDGIGSTPEGSSYSLAKTLGIPIVLVVDAKGTSRSIIPVILGFIAYDKAALIKAVIINNMSLGLFKKLKEAFKAEIPVPVLGCFERNPEFSIESRHLGLKLPGEIKDLGTLLGNAGRVLEETVDINALLEIAKTCGTKDEDEGYLNSVKPIDFKGKAPEIAVAMDESFCFYYDINLKIIEKLGAKIRYFSPLRDESIPKEASGLIFGGGYPELYAKALSENEKMLDSVKYAIESGMPSVAECGGFMYLHENLIDENGESFKMVGAIKGEVYFTGKSRRFGYAAFSDKSGYFLPGESSIKGHEFHYYDSTNNGADVLATKPNSDISWECNHVDSGHWWGFSHLYYPSNLEFIKNFLKKCNDFGVNYER